jgi:hypothetical protein
MTQSVFLIHDLHDKPFARQLAIVLSLAGATVWLDEAETGEIQETLIGKIEKVIRGDVWLTVILSPDSVRSDWVQREVEIALNRREAGLIINVLPLLYKDCEIPPYMEDKLCVDFRNPANCTNMLHKIIDRLELVHYGTESVLPASLAGLWKGEWIWCGRQRKADMFLSSSPMFPSKMIIRYLKSGILTIVEQELDVQISGNRVKLIGSGFRLIEHGLSLGWNLDTFNLSLGESGKTLEGISLDKKGVQSSVLFKRK